MRRSRLPDATVQGRADPMSPAGAVSVEEIIDRIDAWRGGATAPCGARARRRAAARAASLGRLTRRARRPPRDAVVPVCPPPVRRLPGNVPARAPKGGQRDRSFERHPSAPFVAVRAHQERSPRYGGRRASSTLSRAMSAMVCLLAGESATVRSSLPHLRKSTRPRFSRACRSPTRSFDYVVRIAIHSACVPVWTPTRRGNLRAESNGNGSRRYPEAENSHRRRHGMALKPSSKYFTHRWYAREAAEAARFHASALPGLGVDRVKPALERIRGAGRRAP